MSKCARDLAWVLFHHDNELAYMYVDFQAVVHVK